MSSLLLAWACVQPPEPPPAFDPADPQPGWWSGADLPFPRQEHAVVALGGEVVVVGGVDDGPTVGSWVQAYDPVADRWRELPPLPRRLHHPNLAEVDGSLYLLGGLDGDFVQQPVAWRLPPEGEAWEPIRASPRPVGSAGVAVVEGRVHLLGGLNDYAARPWHDVYDPAHDHWTALPDMPDARDHAAVGAVDEVIVVAAGRVRSLNAFVEATWRWTEVDGWTLGAPIPTPRGGVAAGVLDGALHVFGGEGNDAHRDGVFGDHEAYDPVADRWTVHPAMAAPRHGMGAAAVDGGLWVPGGAPVDQFGAEATNQIWVP